MFRAENAQSLAGLGFVIAVCWALSENKKAFPWKLALGSIAVQIGLVLLLFGLPGAQGLIQTVNDGVDGLAAATAKGTQFVFGYMGGGDQPYQVTNTGALFVFAFVTVFEWDQGPAGRTRRLLEGAAIGLGTGVAVTLVFEKLFLLRLP